MTTFRKTAQKDDSRFINSNTACDNAVEHERNDGKQDAHFICIVKSEINLFDQLIK